MWKHVAPDYEVDTSGNVRSFKRGKPKILKPRPDRNGYLSTMIYIDGNPKFCLVHRLVAQAFIPNPDNLPEVNHRNGIKTDNRLENLEWVTHAENLRHARDTGLQVAAQGEKCSRSKLTNEQACYVRDNPDGLTCTQLAAKFNVHEKTISRIQLGRRYKTAGGQTRKPKRVAVSDDVRNEIRNLYVKGSREFGTNALAGKFGVGHTTIWKIVNESELN